MKSRSDEGASTPTTFLRSCSRRETSKNESSHRVAGGWWGTQGRGGPISSSFSAELRGHAEAHRQMPEEVVRSTNVTNLRHEQKLMRKIGQLAQHVKTKSAAQMKNLMFVRRGQKGRREQRDRETERERERD